MKKGLEYAIKILEKRAIHHRSYALGNFECADKSIKYTHQCQSDLCLSIRKSLKHKLRSVENDTRLTLKS